MIWDQEEKIPLEDLILKARHLMHKHPPENLPKYIPTAPSKLKQFRPKDEHFKFFMVSQRHPRFLESSPQMSPTKLQIVPLQLSESQEVSEEALPSSLKPEHFLIGSVLVLVIYILYLISNTLFD